MLANRSTPQDMKAMMSLESSNLESELMNNIQKHDKRLLEWMVKFKRTLDRDPIDMQQVGQLVDMLKDIKTKQQNNYLLDLLWPEMASNSKIPVEFPIPTSSFQLHNQGTFQTNASGNLAILFNPFYLEQGAGTNSTFYVNNNAGLSGTASSNFFTSTYMGQTLPIQVYQKFRLVSAVMHVRYIYRLDAASGVFGYSINFESVGTTALLGVNANLARYGNFNLIDDSYFNGRSNVLEGARLLYIPYDPTTTEFNDLGVAKSSTNLMVYAQGLPPSQFCVRVDTFLNFECTCDPVFQNYIPSDVPYQSLSMDQMKSSVEYMTKSNKATDNLTNFEQNGRKEKSDLESGLLATPLQSSLWDKVTDVGNKYLIPAIEKIIPVIARGLGF